MNVSLDYFVSLLCDVYTRDSGLHDAYALKFEVFGSGISIVCRDVDYARCNACITLIIVNTVVADLYVVAGLRS